tara:strand:- start:2700 stop:2963 length:264 start_codon:yes stop_codon:yes gene_type:complete
MIKYRCKKTYHKEHDTFYSINGDIFIEGEWYVEDLKFHIDWDGWYYSILIKGNDTKYYTLEEPEFKEHFNTVDEVRELEINKVLIYE